MHAPTGTQPSFRNRGSPRRRYVLQQRRAMAVLVVACALPWFLPKPWIGLLLAEFVLVAVAVDLHGPAARRVGWQCHACQEPLWYLSRWNGSPVPPRCRACGARVERELHARRPCGADLP